MRQLESVLKKKAWPNALDYLFHKELEEVRQLRAELNKVNYT